MYEYRVSSWGDENLEVDSGDGDINFVNILKLLLDQ